MGKKLKKNKLINVSFDVMTLSRKELITYINKNINPAKKKIKYIIDKGYYKASPEFRESSKILNIFDNKYNLKITGKKSKLEKISTQDLRLITRSLGSIRELKTRELSMEYKRLVTEYENMGIDYDDAFNILSKLSSEFHEIYAILSYSDEGGTVEMTKKGATQVDILREFFSRLEDKIPTEKQQKKIETIRAKVKEKYSASTVDYIFNNEMYDFFFGEEDF